MATRAEKKKSGLLRYIIFFRPPPKKTIRTPDRRLARSPQPLWLLPFIVIEFTCQTCPIKTALERLKAARTIIALHDIDFQKKFFSVEDRTNYFRYSVEFSKSESISIFSNLECNTNTMRILTGKRYVWSLFFIVHASTPVWRSAHPDLRTLYAQLYWCHKCMKCSPLWNVFLS